MPVGIEFGKSDDEEDNLEEEKKVENA